MEGISQQVKYDSNKWELLKSKREKAISVLESLRKIGVEGYVYGSVARGDVNQHSDIDVVVLSPNLVALDSIDGDHKFIIKATPLSTIKGYISLDPQESTVISFPLGKLKAEELEFYRFGGIVSSTELKSGVRVPGVNKDLRLIIPTLEGHIELEVIGNEALVSRMLNISIQTVQQRVYLLSKRRVSRRSGVFFKYSMGIDETFSHALSNLQKSKGIWRDLVD
jgi:predicted nucleotidyltransferase